MSQPASCYWAVDDDGLWESKCGNAFQFEVDGPEDNGFEFCPYCGKVLVTSWTNPSIAASIPTKEP